MRQQRSSVDVVNTKGGSNPSTPLQLVFILPVDGARRRSLVQLLLEHGADPHVLDCNGKSSLDLARDCGEHEAVRMLQEAAGRRQGHGQGHGYAHAHQQQQHQHYVGGGGGGGGGDRHRSVSASVSRRSSGGGGRRSRSRCVAVSGLSVYSVAASFFFYRSPSL